MFPVKRQRVKEQDSRIKLEELLNNKNFGTLVSRLSSSFQVPKKLKEISVFPKLNSSHGGFCYLFFEDEIEQHRRTRKLEKDGKIINFSLNNEKGLKSIVKSLKRIKNACVKILKCYRKLELKSSQVNIQKLEKLCEQIKYVSEEIMTEYYYDLILAIYSFQFDDVLDKESSKLDFARKVLFATIAFIQNKINQSQFVKKLYFFQHFNGKDLIDQFLKFTKDEKTYIVDVLFQISFLDDPFDDDEEETYISLYRTNFRDNCFVMKPDFSSKLSKILLSIKNKYFKSTDDEFYSTTVQKFIDSIKIVRLSKNLSGFTLMNSTVAINNNYLILNLPNDNYICVSSQEDQKEGDFNNLNESTSNQAQNELNNIQSQENFKYPKTSTEVLCQTYESCIEVNIDTQQGEEQKFGIKENELNIFSNDLNAKTTQVDVKEPFAGTDGFTILTCIHEFAHFYQRSKFTMMFDWFSFNTPKKFLINKMKKKSSELQIATQTKLDPEGGKLLIMRIFGYEVFVLNHYSSLFILNPINWELNEEEFQQGFKKEDFKPNPQYLSLKYPVRCKGNNLSYPVFIGKCGTASGAKKYMKG